jgi:hypothetical protein
MSGTAVGQAARAAEERVTLSDVAKTLLEMWPSSIVESVCEVLADTSTGLTGSEIGRLLAKLGVPDIDSGNTKRHRLSNALLVQQQKQQASNCIVRFITEAMQPGLHFNDPNRRQNLQDGLTERLSLLGWRFAKTAGWERPGRPPPPWMKRSGWPGGYRPSSSVGAPTPRSCGTARRSWCGARSSTPCSRRRRAWPRACASSADPRSTRASW